MLLLLDMECFEEVKITTTLLLIPILLSPYHLCIKDISIKKYCWPRKVSACREVWTKAGANQILY